MSRGAALIAPSVKVHSSAPPATPKGWHSKPAPNHRFPNDPKSIKLRKFTASEQAMPTIDATTFRRDFGRYQAEAHREMVKVTSHGRVIGGFLSSHDLEHFERLKRRERQVHVSGEIPDDIIAAIEQAEYLKPAR
jgi:hypothetical protein